MVNNCVTRKRLTYLLLVLYGKYALCYTHYVKRSRIKLYFLYVYKKNNAKRIIQKTMFIFLLPANVLVILSTLISTRPHS